MPDWRKEFPVHRKQVKRCKGYTFVCQRSRWSAKTVTVKVLDKAGKRKSTTTMERVPDENTMRRIVARIENREV